MVGGEVYEPSLCLSNLGELGGFVLTFLGPFSVVYVIFSNCVNNLSCYVTMKHLLRIELLEMIELLKIIID